MKKYIIIVFVMCAVFLGLRVVRINPIEEYTVTKPLMDTVCNIRAGGENPRQLCESALARITEISEKVDYFSDTSEVTRINNAKANVPIKVSDDLFNIMEVALRVCEASDGAFDITVASIRDLWDVSGGDHCPPDETEISKAVALANYRQIILDKAEKTVTKTADDVRIDLGGAAKGYAADVAAENLRQNGASFALIDLGGNVKVFGKNPSRVDSSWQIGIQKPFAKVGEFLQTVTIDDASVVTAGTYQRYFKWDGKMYHHIMDAKTGYPADSGVVSASVVAESSLLADCLSTAVVVLGEEKGKALTDEFNCDLIVN